MLLMAFSLRTFADSLPDFQSLVEKNGKTVVKISVTTETKAMDLRGAIPDFDSDQVPEFLRKFFEQMPNMPDPQPRRGQGFGSGFIISEDGYIVTNAHVVGNATEIRVSMQDRTSYKAELVGADKRSDVALLKIDAEDLPVAELGDSDQIKVGQWVLAIGSPFGFEYTATQGIVSAVARSLPDDTYVPFIQTDVAVNPGNSGGPLYDTEGRVVGINSQIYSQSGGYMGLSFAIPINVAKGIIEQLKTKGYASRGWLGVMIQNVDQSLAESFGLSKPEGALISQVTADSPAEKSGLQVGDIILSFNGHPIGRSSDLPPIVGTTPVNETVPVDVMRGGKKQVIDVTIGELSDEQGESKVASLPGADNSGLGASVKDLTAEQKKEAGVSNGVMIAEVDQDGAAAVAGIVPGDVLVSFNRQTVDSVGQLRELIKDAPRGQSFPVLIQRGGNPAFLAMTLKNK
ncbi:MAG: DegQ family serine endoprotease [Gammaproteobacteria bacterium]|nr:DegQ family serine endoprotease [Gammaproteobacteria bacterium]